MVIGLKAALGKISSIQMGYSFRSGLEVMERGDIAVIQMKDLAGDHRVDCSRLLRVEMGSIKSHHLVQRGDLVFRSRGQLSTSAILDSDPGCALVAAPLFRIRADRQAVLPEYLNWCINQARAQAHFESRARGTGQKIIGKEALETLEISLPSLERQQQIVDLAELAQAEQDILKKLSELRRQHISAVLMNLTEGE